MSIYKIDISDFGDCAGKCKHCKAGGNSSISSRRGAWSLLPGANLAIKSLLSLDENRSRGIEITIASPVTTLDIGSLDLGDINERVTVLGAPISPDTGTEDYLSKVDAIKSKFGSLITLMLGATREHSSINKQYLFLINILCKLFEDLINGKSMAREVFLIGGVNDAKITDLPGILGKCHKFYSTIFPSGEIPKDVDDIIMTGMLFLRIFFKNAKSGKIKDMQIGVNNPEFVEQLSRIISGENRTHYLGGEFRIGENKLAIQHSLQHTRAEGKVFTKEQIIDQLQRTDAHPVVHFSGGKVNVFHDVDSTNVPGVWVELEKYFGILQRARTIGYNKALIEHFRSI